MEDKKINAVIKMIILPLLIVICFACTTLDNDNAQKLNDDEPTFTIVEYDENKYVYPISLLENFKRGELSTGIISEYRTPNRALFKKFKSDTTFEVVLDMEELPIEKRKYLKHDQIKSFDVSYSPDLSIRLHKVYLYTYKGYFDMAEYRIEQWRTTVMGVTNEGGLFIYPRMLKSNLENYIALPPKEKQPDQQLMIDMMSDEYRIFIDGRAVNDKSIVSQDHKDYYYFYESEQRVSALSQDSESNYYYNEPEKENIRNLILFTKKGYADLVKIYETSKAPELDIIIN